MLPNFAASAGLLCAVAARLRRDLAAALPHLRRHYRTIARHRDSFLHRPASYATRTLEGATTRRAQTLLSGVLLVACLSIEVVLNSPKALAP